MAVADRNYRLTISAQDGFSGAFAKLAQELNKSESAVDRLRGVMGTLAGAFGASLSFVGLANLAKQTIDAAARLDDLSEKTGASVEELSKFAGVARITGQDMGVVESAMAKVAKSLVEAQDSTTDAAEAFRAFGINIKNTDGSLKTAGTVMDELAKKQGDFADGSEKVAALMALTGKNAAELLPYMNDYVRLGDQVSITTAEQAKQAEDFNIQIGLMREEFVKLSNDAILPILPQLTELATSFTSLANSIRSAFSFESGDSLLGKVAQWIKETNRQTVGEIETLKQWWENVKIRWSTGSEAGTTPAGAAGRAAVEAEEWKELAAAIDKASAAYEASGNAAEAAAKKGLKFTGTAGKDAKEAASELKRVKEQFEDLRRFIVGGSSAEAEYQRRVELLGKAWEVLKLPLEEVVALEEQLYQLSPKVTEATKAQTQATEALAKAYESELEAGQAVLDNANARLQKAMDLREAQLEHQKDVETEIKLVGLSTVEREKYLVVLEAEKAIKAEMAGAGNADVIAAIKATRDQTLALLDQKAVLEKQVDVWKTIESTAHDAFMHIFESGKSVFERLALTLKQTLLELLYQMTIKKWMISIGASVGVPGAAANAAGLGGTGGGGDLSSLLGLGNLFGGGTSALGYSGLGFWGTSLGGSILGSTTAGGFGAGFIGGMGAPLATIGELMSGGTAAFGGAAGAMGAGLGAMLPVIGIGLAIAAAAGMFSRPHGPKTGGSASSGVDLDLGQLIPGDIGRLFTPSNEDASAQKLVDAVSQGYLQAARSLGLTAGTAQFAIGFDTDPEGTAGSRVSAQAMVNGRNVYNVADLDVGRDDAALQAALELESKRALLAALQASDLPDYLANVLNEVQVSTATSETIDQIIATAAALKLAVEAVQGLDEKFAGMDPEHIGALVEAFGGLDAFAQNFAYIGENFYTTSQILERNTAKLADAFEALGLEVPDTHAAFLELLDGMDLTTEEGRNLYASVAALAPLFVAVEGTAQQAAEALAEVPDVLDEVAEAAAQFADIGSVLNGAASQADQVIGQIADMVGQLGGTLGERLASQIRITAEAADDYRQKLADGINRGGIVPGSAEQQAIEEIIRRLEDSNASATQQLARFTVLSAQYDADRAEQLIALEKWYNDQRYLFRGNSEALAALQTTFGRRWQEIVDGIAGGVDGTIDELARLRESLRDYLDSLRLNDNLSPLLPQQRLDEAQRQFGELLSKAQGGDAEAMRDIQNAATAYLTEARNMFASGGQYSAIFESVMSALTDLSREPSSAQTTPIDVVAGAMPAGSPVMSQADAEDIKQAVLDLIAEVRAGAKAVADRNDAAATRTAQIIVSSGGR